MLKLVSEVLRDMLWDGGLREFSYKCGQKSIPKQWQDIHLLLLAMYESLLRKATVEFLEVAEKCACGNPYSGVAFWQWVEIISKSNNDDKPSQFWAQTLLFIHSYVGYYFAIRSGNWLLRNMCLKLISPLFFAYSRNKYEELSITAQHDVMTISDEFGSYFVMVNGLLAIVVDLIIT